jgi:DNA-binding protein YbaB
MFGKLNEAKLKAEEMKNKLNAISVESNVQGVKIVANANKIVQLVSIDESLLTVENKSLLEKSLLEAINDAMGQAENISATEMRAMMGGMMPGLGNLFGN